VAVAIGYSMVFRIVAVKAYQADIAANNSDYIVCD
jgi:hypothetical protein